MIYQLHQDCVHQLKAEQYIFDTFILIKELVENSIDANATCIKINVKNDKIVIEDDGNGVEKSSLKKLGCFGCTSKQETTLGVLNLNKNAHLSLGYRGQALFSMSKLAKVKFVTRPKNCTESFCKDLCTGDISFLPRETGSSVIIEDLFVNVPVRRNINTKNYKKHITRIGEYLDAMKIVYNGTFILKYQDKKTEKEVIFSGVKQNIEGYLKENVEGDFEGFYHDLYDFFIFPNSIKKFMMVFCGKRVVKSYLTNFIQKHIEKYTSKKIFNKPSFILILKDEVDMNLSNDKSEIILRNKLKIEKSIAATIENYLKKEKIVELSKENISPLSINSHFIYDPFTIKKQKTLLTKKENVLSENFDQSNKENILLQQQDSCLKNIDKNMGFNICKTEKNENCLPDFYARIQTEENSEVKKEKVRNIVVEKEDFKTFKIIGQFNLGFILCILNKEGKNYLVLVDQHAADEISNYEKIMAKFDVNKQTLLLPKKLNFNALEMDLIEEMKSVFHKNGFSFKRNKNEMFLTGVPDFKNVCFTENDFYNLFNKIKDNEIDLVCDKYKHIMASKACRSSIMVGTQLNQTTMEKIVQTLSDLNLPWYCPHGRPTFIILNEIK
ncbi:PMS1 [Ecytonucleospora hepatopenaei]|uniref:PMS1 n=1 Tax=Ecytonucleospora hepatopenaei TaxID=646526 RepID=A0A1W0E731_9MICR|nr:PMS1 [Ecytonucleospora hepatopenaei]